MSTAELQRTERETSGSALPEASLGESLKFVLTGLLPSVARGLFSPRPRAMKLLTRLNTDRHAIAVLDSIRAKHGGEGVRILRGKIAVLWGEGAIREVLDNSATTYASDAGAKKKGMSHFQPDALTLSRGEDWRDRRRFNEFVLGTGHERHPQAARIVDVVNDEVDRLRVGDGIGWGEWESLFDHITLRVIFGNAARHDHELTALLAKLMGEANRIAGLKTGDDYYELYGRIDKYLADPDPYSLVAMVEDAPHTDRTRVAQQIPHWIFATRDTLAANTYRALALLVSDPELRDGDLRGVLHEAMRLWPTTPLLAREVTRDTSLAGERLPEGTQVMLLNVFNHRDPRQPDYNEVRPERWDGGERNYRFNHLSNGTQDCPGGPLVLFIGSAVLERVLSRYSLQYEGPPLEPPPAMLDFFALRFEVV
jgi:cytochrome P450